MVESLLKQHSYFLAPAFKHVCKYSFGTMYISTENISLKRSFIKMRILLQIELENIISSRYIISGAKRLEVIRAWGALAFRGSASV